VIVDNLPESQLRDLREEKERNSKGLRSGVPEDSVAAKGKELAESRLRAAIARREPAAVSSTERPLGVNWDYVGVVRSTAILPAREYEDLLACLHGQLANQLPIRVFLRRRFEGRSGQTYVIDLGYEFEVSGVSYLTLIEAKCYRGAVGVGEVLEFVAKLDDIRAHKGIMITTRGFQKGAQRVAAANRVALVVYMPGRSDRPETILQRPGDTNSMHELESNDQIELVRRTVNEVKASLIPR
jgi:hypothetical protein